MSACDIIDAPIKFSTTTFVAIHQTQAMCKIYDTLETEIFTLMNFPVHAKLYDDGVVLPRGSFIWGHVLKQHIEALNFVCEASAEFRIVTSELIVALHLPILTDPEYERVVDPILTSDESLSMGETLKLIYGFDRCVPLKPALVPVIQVQLDETCCNTSLN